MEKYYNNNSEDLIATLDIDVLLVDTIEGDNICNLFIKDGILRISGWQEPKILQYSGI